MREFVTAVAAKEELDAEGWIDFPVVEQDADGKEVRRVNCRAKRPSSGQLAYLTASIHGRAPIERKISGAINFCMAIMDEDTAGYLSDRLLDQRDPFELEQLQGLIFQLIEEWSGRPTEPSSDSSESGGTSGLTSTPAAATTSST
jgi:hypothetical protein